MSHIVCFDIGGTFIKYGVFNPKGHLLFKSKMATPTSHEIPDVLNNKVKSLQHDFHLTAIGISSCGLVDREKGRILFSNNIQGYSGMNLGERMFSLTQLPVSVENDVKSACLGEIWQGAVKDKRNAVFLTLGTGIGCSIVMDGKIVNGSSGLAGELGHTVIVAGGKPCSCGRKGCFERYAATSAFVQDYTEEALQKGVAVENVSGETIMELVKQRNPVAMEVYERFIHYISMGLTNVIHLLNPEKIIIGGGITEGEGPFIQDINIQLRNEVMDVYGNEGTVIASSLGNDAGLYGACYLALSRMSMKESV
ncbi:ROK family protein [Rossellomorea arthrocnemi]|uniref:ROK family protein n=1 Tax=Rossellomorea arthrocnemi TaxID=2769542 RepID=UPI001917CB93|nr:ROK family protein [Rossellomorea arthrocnemi]